MFKNKHLKQLQDVQARIKNCKAFIANLKPPSPITLKTGKDVECWFKALFHQHDPAFRELFECYTLKSEVIDYLQTLGEYLINAADYYQKEIEYKAELEQLQKEERGIKSKLGIE